MPLLSHYGDICIVATAGQYIGDYNTPTTIKNTTSKHANIYINAVSINADRNSLFSELQKAQIKTTTEYKNIQHISIKSRSVCL